MWLCRAQCCASVGKCFMFSRAGLRRVQCRTPRAGSDLVTMCRGRGPAGGTPPNSIPLTDQSRVLQTFITHRRRPGRPLDPVLIATPYTRCSDVDWNPPNRTEELQTSVIKNSRRPATANLQGANTCSLLPSSSRRARRGDRQFPGDDRVWVERLKRRADNVPQERREGYR